MNLDYQTTSLLVLAQPITQDKNETANNRSDLRIKRDSADLGVCFANHGY
jgi:hypothetical protein